MSTNGEVRLLASHLIGQHIRTEIIHHLGPVSPSMDIVPSSWLGVEIVRTWPGPANCKLSACLFSSTNMSAITKSGVRLVSGR